MWVQHPFRASGAARCILRVALDPDVFLIYPLSATYTQNLGARRACPMRSPTREHLVSPLRSQATECLNVFPRAFRNSGEDQYVYHRDAETHCSASSSMSCSSCVHLGSRVTLTHRTKIPMTRLLHEYPSSAHNSLTRAIKWEPAPLKRCFSKPS